MLKQWLTITRSVLAHKQGLHTAGKYIAHNVQATVSSDDLLRPDITLDMLGFQKKKLTMLKDYYYHEESIRVALLQLEHRRIKKTYGSTAFTTYNHFAKKERPMHGPCIQSVVLTHLPDGTINTNVYYRTTEVFKKFAADLIFLREVLLPQFAPTGDVSFHFANATYHPMYWVVSAPYLKDPISELEAISKLSPIVHRGILGWTKRFLDQPESLLKFKQGFRVSKHLHRLLDPNKLKQLQAYVNLNLMEDNHAGNNDDELQEGD